MQSILLHNFKSYEHQSINNLNSRINIVLGSNGQGKSNFFKGTTTINSAISFLLTDKFTINRAQFNGTLHRGINIERPEILVEANFSSKPQENKTFKVTKSWSNFTYEELKINDKSRSKGEYENFIDSFGLSYASPYNIVQQGKITQISQMSQNQLYLLLEDSAGVKRFMKKNEQAQNNLAKIEVGLNQVEENLNFLKDKVSQVSDKKNEYEFYSVEEKVRRKKRKRQLINFMGSVEKTLKKMKEQHESIQTEIEQTKMTEMNIKNQIEERQRNIKIITQKALFYEKESSEVIQQTNAIAKKSMDGKKKDLRQLQKKIVQEQKALRESESRLNSLEKQLNSYREKYEIVKMDFDVQGESKDQNKIHQAYHAKIQAEKQNIKSMQEQFKKLIKIHDDNKIFNYSTESNKILTLQVQLAPILEQMKKIQISQIQLGRKKMNTECEVQILLAKKKNQDELIRKILPMIDLRLRQWLQQNKVEGVHGYLIQHVRIDKDVAFAYELAGLPKLCTLLVENDQVAAKVIQINKKIHGKNLNILPLSYIKNQPVEKRSFPKTQNVFSLNNEDWIKITGSLKISSENKLCIQKLVNNTFAKYALVEDYTKALKVSKEYNLNCITGDREIVYADAYMCKVGRELTFEKGKIEQFNSLQMLAKELSTQITSLISIQHQEVQLQNEQIQLSNKKEKIQIQINQLQKVIQQAKKVQSLIQKVKAKQESLKQSIQKSNRAIQQCEESIKNMQSKTKAKFKPQDFKKAERQYFAHKSKVQQKFQQNYQKEKNLLNLLKDLQILKKQVVNIEKKYVPLPELQNKQQILKGLDLSRGQFEEELSSLNKELTKLIERQQNIKQKQAQMLAEITVEEENEKEVQKKLQALRDVNPEEQEEIEELFESLSRRRNEDSMTNKKKQFYTTKDKVLFTKILDYVEKVNFYVESTKKICKLREKLLLFIDQTEKEASKHMKSFVVDFKKHFIHYYLRFVPQGKAEIKTKIFIQKVKGITKNGYSLEIKVSFNDDEGIKKWSEFSGGQKTVLSLCIILAIQKCQPTPFCVFDEVDSALDPFYTTKLVEIITEQSKLCQYFITSFKKLVLNFSEEIANYYLVKSVNRVSNLTLVQKEEAESFIEELTE